MISEDGDSRHEDINDDFSATPHGALLRFASSKTPAPSPLNISHG